MADVIQEIGVLTAKDDDGTVHELYPATKVEAVEGLDEKLAGNVVDNLESTSTTLPLSANQGNVIGEKVNNLYNILTGDEYGDGNMTLYSMTKSIYNNIVLGGMECVDLGTGTSFDLTSYSGYKKFTESNFIVEAVSTSIATKSNPSGNAGIATYTGTLNKSYDVSTGILTVSYVHYIIEKCSSNSNYANNTRTDSVHVYLINNSI